MKILCIAVPDGMSADDFKVVPKVATKDMIAASLNGLSSTLVGIPENMPNKEALARTIRRHEDSNEVVYAAMLAAAPPCKVVELPERNGVDFGWNACLDEIERRAK